jgi:hypothetical protein
VSHASDAQKAFFNAATFNQNIGSWDVSQVTIVPFVMPISSTVNDPSLMAALKLNVIVLAVVFAPPLPVRW